ncbi:hypothetical protein ACOME3_003457 [Neoechinorhynchus agilis]
MKNPIELWAIRGGRSLKEKEYYDEHFGPFYRSCQLYFIPKFTNASIFKMDYFQELSEIQNDILQLKAAYNNESVSLSSICWKPVKDDADGCMIISPVQYFEKNLMILNQTKVWRDHLFGCMRYPTENDCIPKSGAFVDPTVAFGGFNAQNPELTKTFILTILIVNQRDVDYVKRVEAWEQVFLDYAKSLSSLNFRFTFAADRSIKDEVNSASKADLLTIVLSYVAMFVYLGVFLGSFQSLKTILVHTRISLGVCAILVIIISVVSSFGFYSYFGFKTSIIVLEVTPFLLLAVSSGDNFIFVKNYMRKYNSNSLLSVDERVIRNLAEIGPSLLLSSCSQVLAFGIGAAIPVGAIRIFALYSCFAVAVKFGLQITLFVSVFALDCRRQHRGDFDVICCFGIEQTSIKKYKSCNCRLEQSIAFMVAKKYLN